MGKHTGIGTKVPQIEIVGAVPPRPPRLT